MSTVLVAEDDPHVAPLLKAVLTSMGHAAVLCRTGTDLLTRWADLAPALVILDVNLAGDLDGYDVARTLRERGATTPILMLTARARTEDRATGRAAGADDYLAKPFDVEVLTTRVQALIDAGPRTVD